MERAGNIEIIAFWCLLMICCRQVCVTDLSVGSLYVIFATFIYLRETRDRFPQVFGKHLMITVMKCFVILVFKLSR